MGPVYLCALHASHVFAAGLRESVERGRLNFTDTLLMLQCIEEDDTETGS